MLPLELQDDLQSFNMTISEQFKLLNLNIKRESYALRKSEGSKSKKMKKKHVMQFEKTYFLYCSFLAAALALHFKDDM
jgi:hypothetical protein